ncbi:MAG: DoxX family protein [Rhizobiales bacterium]|uniref:DoxX family protein n=1 Tax=Xanthobacter TaxID=279 RepID=UPI00145F6A66|nr:DoxX family protein [Xanthobacter sp. SG618]MBN8914273.1 DoxX family protein [Hyphomicrobiales bacterium]NMN57924.1 putative oxidoreductase [Xanthobacter sp. SG618]
MRSLDDLALLVGRLCIAALFLPAGIGKLGNLAGFAGSLAAKGVPAPMVFGGLAAATEVIGGLLLIAGLWPRFTAIWLAGFTVVATLLSHLFWTFPEAAQAGQQIHFFKNVAIIGGFLFYFAAGPGAFSLGRKKAL